MLKRLTFFGLVVVTFSAPNASALSYGQLSPTDVTEQTDLWVRGQVTSVTGAVTGEDGFGGTYNDVVVEIDVKAATDDETSGVVTIRSNTTFKHVLNSGAEVFAAFKRDGGEYKPLYQLGLYGWIQRDPQTGEVRTAYGPVAPDVFWRWLQGLRYATDSLGESRPGDRAYWSDMVESSDMGHIGLAIDYFQALSKPHDDPLACFSAFTRTYDDVYSRSGPNPRDRRADVRRLAPLAWAAGRDAQRHGADRTGGAIIEFLLRDAHALQLRRESEACDAFANVLQNLTNPELIARLPDVYSPATRPGYSEFESLPTAPCEKLDEWLLQVIQNPAAHGLQGETDVAGVREALVKRDVREVLPILKSWAEGPDLPNIPRRIDDVNRFRTTALSHVNELELRDLPRTERLTAMASRIPGGDPALLRGLSNSITAEDRFLLPMLRDLAEEQWTNANVQPEHWTAATIMQTLPDDKFVPLLRAWLNESADPHEIPLLLKSLAACGENEEAVQYAISVLNAPLSQDDRGPLSQALLLRAEVLLFLGSLENPELAQHVLPFTEKDTLADLEAAYREALTEEEAQWAKHPYPVWQIRDHALLAIARLGAPNRIEILQKAYEREDIRGRFIAALSLYALGDDTGRELVDAYREHRERGIPELEKRWALDFAGGNVYTSVITYLNLPRLDALYLDRIKVDAGYYDDRDLAQNKAFFARNRAPMLAMLRQHLDHSDPNVRDMIVESLQTQTGQGFGYDENLPVAQQQPAIRAWKAYIDAELARAAN